MDNKWRKQRHPPAECSLGLADSILDDLSNRGPAAPAGRLPFVVIRCAFSGARLPDDVGDIHE